MGKVLDPEVLKAYNALPDEDRQYAIDALERRVEQAEAERAMLLEHMRISDAGLLCFAQWCRMNEARFVLDQVILRRVFDAYRTSVPDVEVSNAD